MKAGKRVLPFTAIVGQDSLKEALILNAINQDLMGILIKGQRGTAKSMAVRAIAELLPEKEFSIECPYGCSPEISEPHCDICQSIIDSGGYLRTETRKIKVVTLPLGATEDRVIGSINVEKALKGAMNSFEPGLLAQANRGILYIDEINLLDDNLVDILLDAAAMGVNIVEREGISITHPAKFILVGTMNPEEGELRPQLTDRLGLYVDVKGIEDIDERVKIIDAVESFDLDPEKFFSNYKNEQDILTQKISSAIKILPKVKLQKDLKNLIAKICIDFGIDGHRADILISRCSKTLAALDGRLIAEKQDIEKAAKYVIPHRVRRDPFDDEKPINEKLKTIVNQYTSEKEQDENEKDNQDSNLENNDTQEENNSGDKDSSGKNPENKNNNEDKNKNFNMPPQQNSEESNSNDNSNYDNKNGSNPETEKNSMPLKEIIAPEIEIKKDKKIKAGRGRRTLTLTSHSGKYIKSKIPKKNTSDIAIDATIRSAIATKGSIDIDINDIREKVREREKAVTIVFVVDASGSMGVGKRMEFARSALISILKDSYQKRDKVGFIIFKGNNAATLIKPTSSVYLASKKIKEIPTGGKTPLSSGLLEALRIMSDEIIKDKNCIPVVVLISDGKANVAIKNGNNIKKEIVEISKKLKEKGVNIFVIDADDARLRLGFNQEIIRYGDGKYFNLEELMHKDFKKSLGIFKRE
ncbi:MAG: ATP-binding protein [Actinobacteria bacterium]|nr:ATP-binding protein [Actinomycetota bacterium]